MARNLKQQQQVIVLSALLAIIVGVLLWQYGNRFLPPPESLPAQGLANRLRLPPKIPSALFDRRDYAALKTFGDVPVRPLRSEPSNPFAEIGVR